MYTNTGSKLKTVQLTANEMEKQDTVARTANRKNTQKAHQY